MIIEELGDLREHITRRCTVNCAIGRRDRAVDELPIVEIVPDGETQVFDTANDRLRYATMQVTLRILVDQKAELLALSIFEKLCRFLGDFNKEKGHSMGGSFSGAYEGSQYVLSGTYTLRFRVHETE